MEKDNNNPAITLLTIIVLAQLLIMVAFGLKIYTMNNQLQEVRRHVTAISQGEEYQTPHGIGNGSSPEDAFNNIFYMD